MCVVLVSGSAEPQREAQALAPLQQLQKQVVGTRLQRHAVGVVEGGPHHTLILLRHQLTVEIEAEPIVVANDQVDLAGLGRDDSAGQIAAIRSG